MAICIWVVRFPGEEVAGPCKGHGGDIHVQTRNVQQSLKRLLAGLQIGKPSTITL